MTWMLDKAFLVTVDLRAYDAAAIARRVDVPLEVAKRFVDPARRYRVRANVEYGWVTGTIGVRPALAFVGRPRMEAANALPLNVISFDAAGMPTTVAIPVDDEDGLGDDEYLYGMLEDESGFAPADHIDVPAFQYPGIWHYAVVPFPFHLHDSAVGKHEDDLDAVRDWITSNRYVLHCGNAYFVAANGAVESS